MDDSGQVTQASENDIDQQITAASPLEKDTKRRKKDSENDLANITRKIISIQFPLLLNLTSPNSQSFSPSPHKQKGTNLVVKGMMLWLRVVVDIIL